MRTRERDNSNNIKNQRVIEYEAQVKWTNSINSSTSKSIEMDPLRIDIYLFSFYITLCGPLSMCSDVAVCVRCGMDMDCIRCQIFAILCLDYVE